jgi:hypothetical protein
LIFTVDFFILYVNMYLMVIERLKIKAFRN